MFHVPTHDKNTQLDKSAVCVSYVRNQEQVTWAGHSVVFAPTENAKARSVMGLNLDGNSCSWSPHLLSLGTRTRRGCHGQSRGATVCIEANPITEGSGESDLGHNASITA